MAVFTSVLAHVNGKQQGCIYVLWVHIQATAIHRNGRLEIHTSLNTFGNPGSISVAIQHRRAGR